MKIKVTYGKKEFLAEVKGGARIIDVLESIGVNPQTVLVSKNGEFVPETETASLRDKIEVFKVVSGG